MNEIEKSAEEEEQEKIMDFAPENARPDTHIYLPLSGKYRLVVTGYATKPGCWNYARGEVFDVASGARIADVKRNYSAFPFSWIEGHPNGHDYLVCGEDYQGQTVIELDIGLRRDYLPEAAKKGFAFCWSSHRFDSASKILVVDGCHWACPYEFRFYDFSDPMSGWPEIEGPIMISADNKEPDLLSDGRIKCYETRKVHKVLRKSEYEMNKDDVVPEGDDDNPDKWEVVEDAITTLKREGLKLVVEFEWVSEEEKAKRSAMEEAAKKYEEWKAYFRASDPLYLKFAERAKELKLEQDYDGIGITYDGWCPDFTGQERRWCRRIVDGKTGNYTIDLEWAVGTGPIKLVIYKDHKAHEDKFFEHSVAGMEQAFDYAKTLVNQ